MAEKNAARRKDLADLRAGVAADEIQERNGAFDGKGARIKSRKPFKG